MVGVDGNILNFIGLIVSAIVPVILIKYFSIQEHKRTEKEKKIADELKTENDKKAIELKIQTAQIADDIKKDLEGSQTNIKKELEDSQVEIKKELERSQIVIRKELEVANTEVKKQIDTNNADINSKINIITQKIDGVNERQLETHKNQLSLISDLQHRADLTNGNIENIRNDIMDVQDLIEDIVDKISVDKISGQNLRKRRRKRHAKRNEIESDAVSQGREKANTGNT